MLQDKKDEIDRLAEKIKSEELPMWESFQRMLNELRWQVEFRDCRHLSEGMRIIVNRDIDKIAFFLEGWIYGLKMCDKITSNEFQKCCENLMSARNK